MTAPAYDFTVEDDELNEKFGGGLPTGSLVVIEGPNGLGKSILSQRFTYGLVQNHYDVSYVSTELSVSGFLKQMSSVNYPVKQAFLEKQLKFVSIFTPFGTIEPKGDLVRTILDSDLMESEVVILDTVSDFLVERDRDFQENFSLLNELRQQTFEDTTIVCCVNPHTINEDFHEMLTNAAEVYIEMHEVEEYGKTVNRISVNRFNAAQDNLDDELSFHVRPNAGIVVEIAST